MADTDTAVLDQTGTDSSGAEVEEQTLTTGQLEGETPKPEAKKEAEIDWLIEGPKERDARLKAENDLKALKGGRRADFDRDASIRRTEGKTEETAQTVKMILENLKPLLEPEAVARIDAAQSAFTQTQQKQGFEQFTSEYAAKMSDIAALQGVNPNTHEAYADVRTRFWDAVDRQDREGILKATLLAWELDTILRPGGEKQGASSGEAEKKVVAPKPMMTDLGPGSGGMGSSPSWARAQKIKNVADLSDKDYEKLVAGG